MNSPVLAPGFLSRRALAGAGILALHLMVAYLLLSALMPPPAPAVPPTIAATFPPVPDPIPAPAPIRVDGPSDLQHPPPPDALPVPVLNAPAPEPVPVATAEPPAAGSAVPEAPLRLLGRNVLPDSADYYPPDRIRAGVAGTTDVQVCVDAAGERRGEPAVVASSGDARLDQAALSIARHGHYARWVRGDVPVGNCPRFRIVFRLPH